MSRIILFAIYVTTATLLWTIQVNAQPQTPADEYYGHYCGYGLDVERVSGDDYRDLVTTNAHEDVWIGYGYCWFNGAPQNPGIFQTSIELPFGFEAKFGQLRLGQDQPKDLAITSRTEYTLEGLKIYYNNNDGSLDLHQTLSLHSDLGFISWGKVDNNDLEDLVGAVAETTPYVYVYMNDNGDLIEPEDGFDTGSDIHNKIELADLDKISENTLHELFVISGNRVKIFANNNGIFDPDPLQEIIVDNSSPFNIVSDFAVGDVNKDGYNDLIACVSGDEIIKCYLNSQNGYFIDPPYQVFETNVQQIDLGEINYDGYPDLALNSRQTVKIYENIDGTFNFSEPAWEGTMGVYPSCNEMVFADLKGEGAMSIMCTGLEGDTYGLFVFKDLTNPRPCPPRNFQVEEYQGHPRLTWEPNDEDDIDEYWLYREITDPYEIPQTDQFEVIETFPHDEGVYEYIDNDVWLHTPHINCTAWYFVTALDNATPDPNESLPSEIIRFLAFYHPQGGDEIALIEIVETPERFSFSASPNPFNPVTTLNFTLQEDAQVDLTVYDLSGKLVRSLLNGWCEAGTYNVHFEGSNLPSGVYIYRLYAGGYSGSGKMVLVK